MSIILGSKFACKNWYPTDPVELVSVITKHYTTSTDNVRAVIAPHAGYKYCGETFSRGMGRINSNQTYDKVFIIGPSHHRSVRNTAYVCDTFKWIGTALDLCEIDTQTSTLLGNKDHFELDSEILYPEHSIQLHIPFIQHTLPDVPVVPIIIGEMDQHVEHSIADTIKSVSTENSLFMISSDFTHHGEKFNYTPFVDQPDIKQQIRDFDKNVIDLIVSNDHHAYREYINSNNNTICGRHAISLLLNIIAGENLTVQEQDYSMSGDLTGDYSNNVSYASIIFTRNDQ